MTTDRRKRGVAIGLMATVAAALALVIAPTAASAAALEPTGSLLTERYKAAAAPLPGGDVLVVGGLHHIGFTTASESLASAEVYDGASGEFSATGSMAVSRMDPAAAPLPDGRVLVVGGQIWGGGGTPLASAEIYDPETGEFSATDSMAVARFGAMAAPLPDGRILVAGGYGEGTLSSAEIYDPESEEFSPTDSMASRRGMGIAATLPDGSVLIVARGGGENAVRTEIYDPVTETFSLGPETARPYGGAGGTLDDGTVLLFTEFTRSEMGPLKTTEEYGPVTEAFAGTGLDLDVNRPAVAPLPGGRMLIAGGSSDDAKAFEGQAIVPFAEIYDPSASEAPGASGGTSSGTAEPASVPAGGPNSSAEEAGWEAATASHGTPSATAPRATVGPKAKRACRSGKATGKRKGTRHTRSSCAKPGKRHSS
ncbi:MAG TPA: kelch repeat-containing protein [Solirubrobacterales bacterium]|nr:kelch repeat-containing protein [Solirubrobacterales bacterium]